MLGTMMRVVTSYYSLYLNYFAPSYEQAASSFDSDNFSQTKYRLVCSGVFCHVTVMILDIPYY
jgi:hypothetical protein